MKTIEQIHSDILTKFSSLNNLSIQSGTVLDDFTYAVSDAVYSAYVEIQNSKNPHLYSKLSGSELDDLGILVHVSREVGEEDDSYLHRIMEWVISTESANYDCIENALINLKYASHVSYIPKIYGVGTAAVYIIPTSYDSATISNAMSEVKDIVENVVAADSYVEYIVPPQKQVRVAVHIEYDDGSDSSYVFSTLKTKIQDYINNIAIGDKLEIGAINKIGINHSGVSYFVVVQLYVNEQPVNDLDYMQTVYNKFVFHDITV